MRVLLLRIAVSLLVLSGCGDDENNSSTGGSLGGASGAAAAAGESGNPGDADGGEEEEDAGADDEDAGGAGVGGLAETPAGTGGGGSSGEAAAGTGQGGAGASVGGTGGTTVVVPDDTTLDQFQQEDAAGAGGSGGTGGATATPNPNAPASAKFQSVCDQVKAEVAPATLQQLGSNSCVLSGISLGRSTPQAPNACETYIQSCQVDTEVTRIFSCVQGDVPNCSTATVAEYKACWIALIENYANDYRSVTCDTTTSPARAPTPQVCTTLYAKCPQIEGTLP